jgi:hypothetical protein
MVASDRLTGLTSICRRPLRKKRAVLGLVVVLLGMAFLRVWTSGVYYRSLPNPACAIRLPLIEVGIGADDKGVDLRVVKNAGSQYPAVHVGGMNNMTDRHGYIVNCLGFVIAVLPTRYDGGDYSVEPYAATVVPYWLGIVGAGFLLARMSRVRAWLAQYRRPSRLSGYAAVAVLLFFAVMNLVPSAWRPGMSIRPHSFGEWLDLIFRPGSAHSVIMLNYGFPFRCYESGLINGQSVDYFYGARVGWQPHLAAENICAALLTAFAVVFVESVRRSDSLRPAPPRTKLADTSVDTALPERPTR